MRGQSSEFEQRIALRQRGIRSAKHKSDLGHNIIETPHEQPAQLLFSPYSENPVSPIKLALHHWFVRPPVLVR